jgi:uncharacterized protein with PIN domain
MPGIDHAVSQEGSFVFMTKSREVLRLDPDGRVFVRGEEVGDNVEVYRAFTRWLTDCRCMECGGQLLKPHAEEVVDAAHEMAMKRERMELIGPREMRRPA